MKKLFIIKVFCYCPEDTDVNGGQIKKGVFVGGKCIYAHRVDMEEAKIVAREAFKETYPGTMKEMIIATEGEEPFRYDNFAMFKKKKPKDVPF